MRGTKMTTTALLLRIFVMVLMPMSVAEPRTPAPLPKAITVRLDADYPGWRFQPTSGASASVGRREAPDRSASVLQADFDGNGLKDYAVVIEYQGSDADGHSDRFCRVLVFLRTGTRFRSILLTKAIPMAPTERLHILPVAKGTRVYDLDENHDVICERDAIDVGYDGRGPCATFVYRKGKFVSIWTCD